MPLPAGVLDEDLGPWVWPLPQFTPVNPRHQPCFCSSLRVRKTKRGLSQTREVACGTGVRRHLQPRFLQRLLLPTSPSTFCCSGRRSGSMHGPAASPPEFFLEPRGR